MRKSPLDKDKGLRRLFQPRSSSAGSKASAKRRMNSSGSLVEWYALGLLAICTAASSAGTQGWSVLLITVQKELDLSSMVIGLISGWCGLAVIIGQLLLLPFMLRKLKWSEVQVVLFGFAISSCILALGFISNLWAVLILGWVFSLGLPLVMTVVFAMFSRLCDPSVKGRVVGLVAFVSNMTKVLSVLLCGVLYDIAKWIPYTMDFGPAATFLRRAKFASDSSWFSLFSSGSHHFLFLVVIRSGGLWNTREHRVDEGTSAGLEQTKKQKAPHCGNN
ncbi:hypothetical protein FOZ62_005527, partial [Perkinsus olseni]